MILADNEVYDWLVPPMLGGAIAVNNLSKMDFVVSLNLAGQLVRQIKDLPPGTKITGFRVD